MTDKYIDIDAVLEAKAPSLKKKLPGFIISYLKRIAHENELNDFLSKNWKEDGITFISNFLVELGISYDVDGADKLPESGRSTFVCNHALGGLDGIILLKMLFKPINRLCIKVVSRLIKQQHIGLLQQ